MTLILSFALVPKDTAEKSSAKQISNKLQHTEQLKTLEISFSECCFSALPSAQLPAALRRFQFRAGYWLFEFPRLSCVADSFRKLPPSPAASYCSLSKGKTLAVPYQNSTVICIPHLSLNPILNQQIRHRAWICYSCPAFSSAWARLWFYVLRAERVR